MQRKRPDNVYWYSELENLVLLYNLLFCSVHKEVFIQCVWKESPVSVQSLIIWKHYIHDEASKAGCILAIAYSKSHQFLI